MALLHCQSSHTRLIWCEGPQILLCDACFLSFSCDFMHLNKSFIFSDRNALMILFLADVQAEPCQFMPAEILPHTLEVLKHVVQSLPAFDLWRSCSTLTASLPEFWVLKTVLLQYVLTVIFVLMKFLECQWKITQLFQVEGALNTRLQNPCHGKGKIDLVA